MSKVEVGRVLHETYRLDRLIGEGSMGAVYEASHLRLRRRFAVKLLLPSATAPAESMARFRREAQITSELGHPNIVEVVDFNQTDDGTTYIVMELLEGEDLGSRIRRETRIALIDAERILRQAASGLQAAHELGVVHRDLKPQNLFLCRRRDETVVKVLDFGISKVLSSQSQMTRAETLMGTPSYMAPELAVGNAAEATARTDIFGLGAIGFEMLCGTAPFVGVSVLAVLYKVVHEPTPSVRSLCPAVPHAVDEVLQQAMAKLPEDRFATMDELAEAFSRALGATVTDGSATEIAPAPSLETLPPIAVQSTAPELPAGARQAGELAVAATLSSHTGSTLSAGVGELAMPTLPSPGSSRVVLAALGLLLASGVAAALLLIPAKTDEPPLSVNASAASSAPPDAARVTVAPSDAARVAVLPPDASAAASEDSRRSSPRDTARPRLVAQTGKLRVACPEGVAEVFVDRRRMGETGPIWEGALTVGVHRLEVRQGALSARRSVRIRPGQLTKVSISLRGGQ